MDQKPEITTGKVGKILEDIGLGNYFLNKTPIAQNTRARIDIKLKASALLKKKQLSESRESPQNGRKSPPAIQQIKD
jgi:hypothetical protein